MPAVRPRASFEPIPPDFDVRTFVETADNFRYADRISYEMIKSNGVEQFEKLVLLHVIIGGKPLVIDGFEEVLDPWTFTPSWLRDNHGEKVENARNLTTKENIPLTVKHYLKHMSKLTEQFFDDPERYRDKTRQRIYLKDIDCPPVWQDKLKEHIPQGLFYLNESTGEIGGPGALDDPAGRKGRGIGRAGDLMSSLPPEMRAENLMCYVGHEGTYTPSHREMCASLGQNIMVNASDLVGEGSKPERPGSSIWFMTETKDRHLVSEYWLSFLGHDIEVENHFAQLIAWKKAPFKTYVVEQRAGDFILIPPLAPHQVWNRGSRTMKIAWNRTTVETLELALSEALPNSRVVCRDEQYKNKAIVYYTLLKYSSLIKSARAQVEMGGEQAEAIQRSVKIRQVQRDFKRLFDLFKTIMLSEMFAPDSREHPEFEPYDSNVTCAYCRCNIFNRFMTCKSCKNLFSSEMDEPYDVCMDCYCMGRSCGCQSDYTWTEQWKWKDLLHRYEEWRAQIIDVDGQMTEKTPLPLQEERRYLGKKTLAQVCQEQLRLRPFVNVKDPLPEEEEEEEDVQVDEYGMMKKPTKKKSKQWNALHKSCHFCLHRHPKWKMAFCSNCDLSYCYGTLFRAHDMMPLTIMEHHNWKCPHCQRICNTGNCRRDPRQHPYEPKGTLLGHDTRKVADPRSVECLVDFSVSNLNWLREEESAMQRRRDEAERAKLADPSLDDRYMDDDHDYHDPNRDGIAYSPVQENGFEESTLPGGDSYVAPTAIMPDLFYPNPDQNGELPRLGKRNRDDEEEGTDRRRKKNKQRKSKDGTILPFPAKRTSGQQYQKEVQRKLLEDAKREDRYILVAARMKGKSKIVKLPMVSDLLEAIERRPVPERPTLENQHESREEAVGEMGSILQSDVLPVRKPTNKMNEKEKGPKTFRYRVTEDETYSTRKRNPEIGGPVANPGKPTRSSKRYEEVSVDSEEDMDDQDVGGYTGPGPGRQRARESNWLARKNAGEEDLPTELPANFKDGQVNPNREKNRERQREYTAKRKSLLVQPKVTIRPTGCPPGRPRKSTGDSSDQPGVREEDDQASALLLAQSAAAAVKAREKDQAEKERAAVAVREAQDNMRAKMGIAEWFEGSEDGSFNGFIETMAADDEPLAHEMNVYVDESPTSPRTGPPQPTNSIFAKPGMVGKKIKIVSAQFKRNGEGPSKTTTTTTIKTPLSNFTSVNKKGSKASKQVDLSSDDSDGDDKISARAPVPEAKTLTGRPKGRSSMVPTRGASSGKRGRGRPRKTL